MVGREIVEVPILSDAIRRLGAPTSVLVRSGNLIVTCGMPPIDLRTGAIVAGDIGVQAKASLDALQFALSHVGASFENVVKTTVYVTDGAFMAEVNAVYRNSFLGGFPARTSVAVKAWTQPFDIEIECLAVL